MLCHPGITRRDWCTLPEQETSYRRNSPARHALNCRVCQECNLSFVKYLKWISKQRSPWSASVHKTSMDLCRAKVKVHAIVEDYWSFPFAVPCPNMHSSTVIDCIQRLLYLSQIMCIQIEVIICIEGTTVLSAWSWCSNEQLHPISSNRESERYHSITPKAVTLALTSRQLNVSARERVLPDALHSIRSLLCTSTNAAPHEIFRLGPTISKPHGLPTCLMSPGKVFLSLRSFY